MTQARLEDSRRVTLNSSGNGEVRFGPGRPNEVWHVTRINVKISTQTLEAKSYLYRGTAGSARITGTVTGSTGDTDDGLNETLQAGEFLTNTWEGGDAGSVATVSFWGTIN